jgi:hypothetical protein
MQPPPSRYRVVERGGRLVVIDSAVGGTPPAAKDLVADALLLDQYPRLRGETDRVRATAQSLTTEPPGLLSNVAATVCSDQRGADGRLQWTTARWYDAKGPRTIALSDTAEHQLGFFTLALLVVTVGATVIAVGFGWIGFAMLFVALSVPRQARPAATRWIDRLATA